ncbi:O-antigen ligase family protein [Diaminobutyricibacter tongyongensis]|uniref:O-antigen ligase family protein n=2 Tax=Leifsonia tongyongensis TaxID=1268043 RepID=A0A6L9XTS0_9MICO|nr:O-antigen ligase family protein [Diaminobutyricibacter tongyongensis]
MLLLFIPTRLIVGPLGSAGAPSMLFGVASLILWLFIRLGTVRAVPGGTQPVRLALGIFFVTVGISYVLAMSGPMSPAEVSPADVALLSLASWGGTLLLTNDNIPNRSRLETLIWRICICGGLIALLGIVQVLTKQLWVDQLSIPGLTGTPGYGLNARGGRVRPSGTATHPIEYGTLITIILPLALYVGFNQTHRRFLVRWLPAAALAAVVPLTSSRSAYLGVAVGLVVCLIGWNRTRRLRVLAIIVAGVAALSVVTPGLLQSIINLFAGASNDPSIASRTDSYSLAAEFLLRKPLFGRGLGTFLPIYRIFDNQYLLLLVTVGVVGAVAFVALLLSGFISMVRLRASVRDDGTRDLALALAAAIATGAVCLFTFDAFAFPMTMGTLFLVLGLAGSLRRIERTGANFTRLL